jgi:DNA-binding MarR family transcriptional regulator
MSSTVRAELLDRIEHTEQRLAALSLREQSSSLLSLNLTVQQFQVLLLLWTEGSVPARAIAQALHVGANTATGVVDRLVDRSLVQRQESARDRRVRLVSLSDNGLELLAELTESARAQRRRLLERLPTSVLEQFDNVLEHLAVAAAEG